MANFQMQRAKANLITSDVVNDEIFRFVKSIGEYMVDLNRKQIREESKDIYGDAIGFYSRATEIITKGAKKAGEPFDGYDTGSWLNNFYVTVLNDTFYFGSTDPKTDDILNSPNWLSQSLFGLSDDNLNKVIQDRIKPFILAYYRKTLGV